LGAVAFEEGNMALALKEYQQAEAINGHLPEVHYREGECLLRLKRYDEAITAFRKEIDVSGEDASAESGLAEAYDAKGMTAEAEAARKRATPAKSASPSQE
jgi:Flp pilus assembly protein TadD